MQRQLAEHGKEASFLHVEKYLCALCRLRADVIEYILLAGNAAPLEKVVSHVAAGKENLGDDAADIAEKALQLIPMLQHAEQIFARHQSRTALHTSQEGATSCNSASSL